MLNKLITWVEHKVIDLIKKLCCKTRILYLILILKWFCLPALSEDTLVLKRQVTHTRALSRKVAEN